jgi:hypothetical protein
MERETPLSNSSIVIVDGEGNSIIKHSSIVIVGGEGNSIIKHSSIVIVNGEGNSIIKPPLPCGIPIYGKGFGRKPRG